MRDVNTLTFRYFGRRNGEEAARWHDEWIRRKRTAAIGGNAALNF